MANADGIDPRAFATPYDLAEHLNSEFYENIHSKKWLERKDAIQGLIDIMEKNQVFVPNESEIQKLIGELSKLLTSDNNINVAAVSALALSKIAYGSASIFKPNASSVILNCLTRMKDVKPVIKNACTECVDMAYTTTTLANVLEPIKSGLAITAPGSKIQSCEFFTRIMLKVDFPTAKASAASTKEVVDQLCKLALGSDVACREASMRSLAAFMRAVTKQIAIPLLSPVAEDKLKMAKVEENYDQFIVEHPFDDGSKKVEATTQGSSEEQGTSADQVINSVPEEIDPRTFATPYDLTKHLNKEFYENIHSSKWLERKDAIQGLVDIMEKNQVFVPNEPEIQKLIGELTKLLSTDSNINVAAVSALALSKIAYGAAEIFKHNASSVILNCLTRMKDLKPVIQNACTECVDMAYTTTTFANTLEPIKAGLSLTAPGSKIQSCEFFTRIMLKVDFATTRRSSPAIKEIVDSISKLALGSDVACREAAMRSLGALMRAVSQKVAMPMLTAVASDKLKMAKIEENYKKYIEEHPFKEGKLEPSEQASLTTTSSSQTSTKEAPKRPAKAPTRVQATPQRQPTARVQSTPQRQPAARVQSNPQRQPVRVSSAKPATAVSNGVSRQVPAKTAAPRVQSGIAQRQAPKVVPAKAASTRQPPVQPVASSRVHSGITQRQAPRVVPASVALARQQSAVANDSTLQNTPNHPKFPSRTQSANQMIPPNVVRRPVAEQAILSTRPIQTANGNPKAYGLIQSSNVKNNDENGKRSMLRPPSSVVRPTKSIEDLAGH